jgi:demethylmenaquinone methyltransferase/2-methoxy-6-polyprenyl-1,4-benzoquinol methylase
MQTNITLIILLAAVLVYYVLVYTNSGKSGSPDVLVPRLGSGTMFDSIAPYYDLANTVMSFGLHSSWRRVLVESAVSRRENRLQSYKILDMATGTGDLAIALAVGFQGKSMKVDILGVDPSASMLAIAYQKVEQKSLSDVIKLEVGNAMNLQHIKSNSFDIVSMSFGIRNVEDRNKALIELRRVLKSDGDLQILEFNFPKKGMIAPLGQFIIEYVTPNLGKLIAGSSHSSEYHHLSDSIRKFPDPDDFTKDLQAVGFEHCIAQNVFLDAVYLFSC